MNTTPKGKRPHTPHCRGGVSSMLRTTAAGGVKPAVSSSGFGLLDPQALVQRMARAMVLTDDAKAAPAAEPPSSQASHPMFRRGGGDEALWRSTSFGAKAVWQDSRFSMD